MKKFLVSLLVIAVLVVGGLIVASLLLDSGKYEFESMSYNGMEIKEGDKFLGMTLTKDHMTLTINNNGEYTLSSAAEGSIKGTWSKEGGDIVLKGNNGSTIRVVRNGFTITIQSGNQKITLKKSIFSF